MEYRRVLVFKIFFIAIISIIVIKLFWIQILNDDYKSMSFNNSVRELIIYPSRGEIVARGGEMLAMSKEAYELFVTPKDIAGFDTVRLGQILDLTPSKIDSLIKNCKAYSYQKPSLLVREITNIQKLRIDEMNLLGFDTRYRSVRSYPEGVAGNVLGYVGLVSPTEKDLDLHYDNNDYVGKSGLEKYYEKELRGEKGASYQKVNVYGAVEGSYNDGQDDYSPTTGSKLTVTIDLELQRLGEQLLEGKVGSVVAIEPSTGEILALVSTPTYDPELLLGEGRSENYSKLFNDPRKPLYNRAVMGTYPPGSTFKNAVGLVALSSGAINYNSYFSCVGGFKLGNFTLGCHAHPSPVKIGYALQTSCNSFFCNAFLNDINQSGREGIPLEYDKWAESIRSFGFGQRLGTDVIGEQSGFIPTSEYYTRALGRTWNGVNIISVSIGQGEILVTPLQIANFGAVLANKGFYYTPHLIKMVDDEEFDNTEFSKAHYADAHTEHYEAIVNSLWRSVNVEGSGAVARVEGLDICGKTGTSENGFGDDHSSFLAFAPRNNPKIVVAAYIEHGGFGSSVAAPVASLMIEKYLTDSISRPKLVESVLKHKIEYPNYDNQ